MFVPPLLDLKTARAAGALPAAHLSLIKASLFCHDPPAYMFPPSLVNSSPLMKCPLPDGRHLRVLRLSGLFPAVLLPRSTRGPCRGQSPVRG